MEKIISKSTQNVLENAPAEAEQEEKVGWIRRNEKKKIKK